MAAPAPEPRYGTGIFFENSKYHIRDFEARSRIKIIDVGETAEHHSVLVDSDNFQNYIVSSGLQVNTYNLVISAIYKEINYDSLAGIKDSHFLDLNEWILGSPPRRKGIAIFDWDRTLTVFEGIYLPLAYIEPEAEFTDDVLNQAYKRLLTDLITSTMIRTDEERYETALGFLDMKPMTIEDLIMFYCGGAARIEMLRSMFKLCSDTGVDVMILTNNTACNTSFFRKIVEVLVHGASDYEIVCSWEPPFRGSKINFILTDERFELLRKAPSGGKHRVSKKHRHAKTRKRLLRGRSSFCPTNKTSRKKM